MTSESIIALLEARIAYLAGEVERQPRTGYAQLQRWRKLEAEHLLKQVRKLMEDEG